MKWLAAITLAVSVTSSPDLWLQFTPCGYNLTDTLKMEMEPAPNVKQVLILKKAIVAVYRHKPQTEPICTILLLQGNRIQPVLGSYDETVRKIRGQ